MARAGGAKPGAMRVLVLGAGATGLAAGYLLARRGIDVTVVEASDQPGGLLSTFQVGNTRLERFYHHFFTHDAEVHWLLDELGLRDRVTYRDTEMGVYRDGRIHPLDGPLDVLCFDAVSFPARLRFGLASIALARSPGLADEEGASALEWLRRWAGAEATEAIWEPLFRSKFGRYAEQIPVAWLAGRLRQRERSRDGLDEKLGYLEGSLQLLVDHLVESIRSDGGEILLSRPASSLRVDQGRVTGVATPDGDVRGDLVISTLPTPILAKLVEGVAPGYARRLDGIEYMGVLCTILSLDESLSPVYWLNVADPGFDFGGVIEQTRLVPPSEYGGRHLVYLSRYLETDHELWHLPDDLLLERQLDQIETLFGRTLSSRLDEHWIFRGRYAAPVTDLYFSQRIPGYTSPIDGLYVAAMPHVYPDERSTNNSIRVAAAALEAAGFDVNDVPEGPSLAGTHGWPQTD